MLRLETGEMTLLSEMNSAEGDSYRSWSSNGRWVVFRSRCLDGMFTRLYIGYFDTEGYAHIPFLLPQKVPLYDDYSLKSYNIPEFISRKIEISPQEFAETAKEKASPVKGFPFQTNNP
jgi:hypothetical protein